MNLFQETKMVNSHIELSSFISKVQKHLNENPSSWANTLLEDFLEALSAWIRDMEGYYQNNDEAIPKQPTWKTFAEMLLAAKVYE